MPHVVRSTIIDAPVERLWSVLRDFNGHDRWHPIVARSEIERAYPADRIGCVRRFVLRDGNELREQLLTLSDLEMTFSYCLLDTPIPLFNYVAHVRLLPVTDGNRSFWHPIVARGEIERAYPPDRVGCIRRFQLRDGSELREQLLTLSDLEMTFSYCLLDTPIPLFNYVAHVRLLPVTDGNRSFWHWESRFTTPRGREAELARLVGDEVYTNGIEAVRRLPQIMREEA